MMKVTLKISKQQLSKMINWPVLTIVFYMGVLCMFNWNGIAKIRYYGSIISIIFFAMFFLLNKKSVVASNKSIGKSMYFLCSCILFSSIVRMDIKDIICTILIGVSYNLAEKTKISVLDSYKLLSIILVSSLLFSFVMFPLSAVNSKGIFYCFVSVIVINQLCLRKKDDIWIFGIVVFIFFTIISISRSRTAIAGFIYVVVMSYGYLFLKRVTIRNCMLLFSIIGSILFFYGKIENSLEALFVDKWGGYEDITSGRMTIWMQTVQNISFFGDGIDFLKIESASGLIFDAHNSIFQVLGCFGIVGIIGLIPLIIRIFSRIIKSEYRIIYINFFGVLVIISMFENLDIFTSRTIPITILVLYHIIFLSKEEHRLSWYAMKRGKNSSINY